MTKNILEVFGLASLPEGILRRHELGEVVRLAGHTANVTCNTYGQSSLWPVAPQDIAFMEGPRVKGGGHFWTQEWTATTAGPWCVVLGWNADGCNNPTPFVSEIHVWGDPDVAPIEKIVLEHLHGRGADRDYVLAGDHKERRREWMKKNILPGSKPWLVRVGDAECQLRPCHVGGVQIGHSKIGNYSDDGAPSRIFNDWYFPVEERIAALPSKQARYARALVDPQAALEWFWRLPFFILDGKLVYPGETGYLQEVRDEYRASGPFAPMNDRPEVRQAVEAAALKLGESLAVEHVDLRFRCSVTLTEHLQAAGLPETWHFDGAAQCGTLRFVTASEKFQGPLSLGVCEADNAETTAVRPCAEDPKSFVWLDAEAFGANHGLQQPSLETGGSRLKIWRVR